MVRTPHGLIPGAVALDSAATFLTFAPLDTLPLATDYTLTLAAGIEDLAGNARPDSLVTRFSTALAFHSVGRLFIANDPLFNPRTLGVLDILTDQPVPGSPIPLEVAPIRLMADSERDEMYLLYATVPRRCDRDPSFQRRHARDRARLGAHPPRRCGRPGAQLRA